MKNNNQISNTSYYRLPCGKFLEDFIYDRGLNFNMGSALKYEWRKGNKDGETLEKDSEKARHYVTSEAACRGVESEVVENELAHLVDEARKWEMQDGAKIESLSIWDWETLVASWRYFQNRSTISSAMFPSEIVKKYWRSELYSDNVLMRIANQFANIDHASGGEEDWKCANDCDRTPWTVFYAFCKGFCSGFLTAKVKVGSRVVDVKCFRCETTGRLHPVKDYISSPVSEAYIAESRIKGVSKN